MKNITFVGFVVLYYLFQHLYYIIDSIGMTTEILTPAQAKINSYKYLGYVLAVDKRAFVL